MEDFGYYSAHHRSSLCAIASSLIQMTYEAIPLCQFRLFNPFNFQTKN